MIHEYHNKLGMGIHNLQNETGEIEKTINKAGDAMYMKMTKLQSKANDIGNVSRISLDKQNKLLEGQSEALQGLHLPSEENRDLRVLGRTWSRKPQNEAVATNKSKKLKKSNPKDAENDKVMDQKMKDLGDLGDLMSEEEVKSDMVDPSSDDEPKGHVGESELVGEGGFKKDKSMPIFVKELKGGVVEMVQNPVKEDELVCESKSNVNEEMKAEPRVEKTNDDLVKDEKIEEASIIFCFFLLIKYCFCQ
nr:protein gamete expressed 1 [Quercus suber]